jgi:DDE superfamily endonuclease
MKMNRILDLYDRSAAGQIPDRVRVICVDEFGPLNLQPRPGHGWFPTGRPAQLRATYRRYGGVRSLLAALDLTSGQMFYRLRDRKRWQEFLAFLRQLRARFPRGWLHVVYDNFLPAPQAAGQRLVRRSRCRVGLHPDPCLLAELDRVRVHRAALLRPRRQRLPLPRRAGSRDRRLHPLGQQARNTEAALRSRVQDAPTRLLPQRALVRRWG